MRYLPALLLLLIPAPAFAQPPAKPDLPRVLLIGDSIRLGYAPLVAKKLEGVAEVVSIKDNFADTANTLKMLDKVLADSKPTVVHFNCGLHDLKLGKKTQTHQVPIDDYQTNLNTLVTRIRKVTPHVVFANTTPILDARHAARKADFDRFEKDVRAYNAKAFHEMERLGVPINDLYEIVQDGGEKELLGKDGTHFTPAGNERLADAVADCVRRQLKTMNPTRLKAPASGPDAVKDYLASEKANDALVPDAFKKMAVPAFPVPANIAAWAKRRPDVKAKVVASLGDVPPRPGPPKVRLVSMEHRWIDDGKSHGFTIWRVRIDNGVDGEMSAMLLMPHGITGLNPAVLWLHSSSYDHTQLLVPGMNGGDEPLGVTFVKRGWVVLAPDAAWYGERAGQGPAGSRETTREQMDSQHKYHLWFGRTLWGMFVRDDQIALDYLSSFPRVDPTKIGVTGISMGSTRAWWLAAVDDRVAAVVGVACLTRYENLLRHGQLRQHGTYYFVNGLLKHFDSEAVVSLIAPRPALFLTGELDAGSPADGIKVIEEKAGGVFKAVGAAEKFKSVRYADVGHTYTPQMRAEMLAWFDKWLK